MIPTLTPDSARGTTSFHPTLIVPDWCALRADHSHVAHDFRNAAEAARFIQSAHEGGRRRSVLERLADVQARRGPRYTPPVRSWRPRVASWSHGIDIRARDSRTRFAHGCLALRFRPPSPRARHPPVCCTLAGPAVAQCFEVVQTMSAMELFSDWKVERHFNVSDRGRQGAGPSECCCWSWLSRSDWKLTRHIHVSGGRLRDGGWRRGRDKRAEWRAGRTTGWTAGWTTAWTARGRVSVHGGCMGTICFAAARGLLVRHAPSRTPKFCCPSFAAQVRPSLPSLSPASVQVASDRPIPCCPFPPSACCWELDCGRRFDCGTTGPQA